MLLHMPELLHVNMRSVNVCSVVPVPLISVESVLTNIFTGPLCGGELVPNSVFTCGGESMLNSAFSRLTSAGISLSSRRLVMITIANWHHVGVAMLESFKMANALSIICCWSEGSKSIPDRKESFTRLKFAPVPGTRVELNVALPAMMLKWSTTARDGRSLRMRSG